MVDTFSVRNWWFFLGVQYFHAWGNEKLFFAAIQFVVDFHSVNNIHSCSSCALRLKSYSTKKKTAIHTLLSVIRRKCFEHFVYFYYYLFSKCCATISSLFLFFSVWVFPINFMWQIYKKKLFLNATKYKNFETWKNIVNSCPKFSKRNQKKLITN